MPLPEPRALTRRERSLLDFLLAGPMGRNELRKQAMTARVVAVCSCGCPSLYLEVDPSAPSARFDAKETPNERTDWVPIAARRCRRGRSTAEVTLHVVNGRLEELEIWGYEFGVRPRIDPSTLEYVSG